MLDEVLENYSYFYILFDLIQLHFSYPHMFNSQCKYRLSFSSKDHEG